LLLVCATAARPASAQVYEVVRAFNSDVGTPYGRLYQDAAGALYGMTDLGGALGIGSVFRLEPDGGGGFTFHEIHAFTGIDGQQPIGGLVSGSDGFLYGSTTNGGFSFYGTVFQIDPSGRVTTLHDFLPSDGPNSGSRLAVGPEGFYGTSGGGTDGLVYRVKKDGTFQIVHAFDGADGSQPYGGVILGSDGWFYGTTYSGPGGASTIYRVSAGGSFESLHTLSPDEGAHIQRGVTEARGHFYGVALEGGAQGGGTAFRVDANGSFTKFHDFGSGGDDGVGPGAPVFAASDGNLYGSTLYGGSAGFGTLFRIDPADALTTVHSFTGLDGREPNSQLMEAQDGSLYGPATYSTHYPGFVYGVIFRFQPSAGEVDVIYAFPGPPAVHPLSGLVEAANGDFYGTAPEGGASSYGSVYRLSGDLNDESVSDVHDFQGDDGFQPGTPLVLGSDGSLYGVVTNATTSGGTAYRFDPPTGFTLLHAFTPSDGTAPNAPLLEATPGNFYGVTDLGGANGYGTAFHMDASGTVTAFHDFQTTDGTRPRSLMKALDGNLYGTCLTDGLPASGGSVFEIALPAQTLTPFRLFDTTEGNNPAGPLAQAADGTFYGATAYGGDSFNGTVFSMDATGDVAPLHSFSFSEGVGYTSGLLLTADGTLYGVRDAGSGGILYQITTDGTFSVLHQFGQGLDGISPVGNLIQASNLGIYGVTRDGGAGRAGVIFRLWPAPIGSGILVTGALEPSSGPAAGGTSVRFSGAGLDLGATVKVGGISTTTLALDSHTLAFVTPPLPPATFPEVEIANPGGGTITLNDFWFSDFLDVDSVNPYHDYIRTIFGAGITAGCGAGNFCPDTEVTRGQMAVFLLKAEHGGGYTPPQCTGIFADVACTPGVGFPDWIEQLYAEAITGGCAVGPLRYCPGSAVTRAQMAVFLLKAEHGSGYVPNPCAGIFADVACTPGVGFPDWIEQLYAESITGGCAVGPLRYCPDNPNLRRQMAVFLAKTFLNSAAAAPGRRSSSVESGGTVDAQDPR
jgi:uncharacterized repeat protein (TIGR03803 family)